MPRWLKWWRSQRCSAALTVAVLGAFVFPVTSGFAAGKLTDKAQPILLVVLDPLAKEMACTCVKGYGQRDYRKLAAQLKTTLKQPVSIEFSDDLAETLKLAGPGREIIAVGIRSLVSHGASEGKLAAHPVAMLTDSDGNTTHTAAFIVRANDPAQELKDVAGRSILFGLTDADQKLEAAIESLRDASVPLPAKPEKRAGYSDAALDVLDSTSTPAPVAVIPTYALPLLEGCGSVKPGSFKVIGKTRPVPFITVFLSDNIAATKRELILKSLLQIKSDAKLLKALESRDGFKPIIAPDASKPASSARDWPDWRGPDRDGHVPRLPARLPASAKLVWKKAAVTGGLAGLCVSDGRLILAERDPGDENDLYRCLSADSGELLWVAVFPAPGRLDYGQAPRATPVARNGRAYLLGAFGELRCVSLADGKLFWKRQLPQDFKTKPPTWGMCATPLLVDDLLIVNPGATNASLVALDCRTGRTRWLTPGTAAAYSSFICGEFGGHRQIVGYDQNSLGGWEAMTGKRLWRLVPPSEGDFNVPTPLAVDGGLFVATENNGARLYRFDGEGRIVPGPAGAYAKLTPDTSSPVAVNGRVFGVYLGLHCLDARNKLNAVWHHEDDALGDHASLMADDERVLVTTVHGELLLLDARSNDCNIISRLKIFDDDVEVYSHPALVGTRLFVRGGSSVMCVDISPD